MAERYFPIEELRQARQEEEERHRWRDDLWMNDWCGGPVEVRGHLIPCALGKDHTGRCVSTDRAWKDHVRKDSRDYCLKSCCPAEVL